LSVVRCQLQKVCIVVLRPNSLFVQRNRRLACWHSDQDALYFYPLAEWKQEKLEDFC
jgi:hypothetical protein